MLSRADFYALSGQSAVEYAIQLSTSACPAEICATPMPSFQFVYGRKDCASSPDLPDDTFVGLPPATLDNKVL